MNQETIISDIKRELQNGSFEVDDLSPGMIYNTFLTEDDDYEMAIEIYGEVTFY